MDRGAAIVTFVPLVAIAAIIYQFSEPPWSPLRIAGLIVLIVAVIALTIARLQLGNSFSVTPQAKALITHGIYSRIRNPIYVFGAFTLVGVSLFIDRPYLLWLLVPVLMLQITRARAEARVLEERFGEDYRRYKASTWF
jgi:protein-S-isoprenylcysteine O-methyltransferase Ste14